VSRGPILSVERHLCRLEKAARARRDACLVSSVGPDGSPRNLLKEMYEPMSPEAWKEEYCGKGEE
jgi:hypothetical protein